MRFRQISVFVACMVLGLAAGARVAGAVVFVDCGAGDTIADALLVPDPILEIEFDGTCVEEVVITRDDVILRGANPAATIQGSGSLGPLEVRNASNVDISGMTLTGGVKYGFKMTEVNRVFVRDVLVTGNEQWGMVLGHGGSSEVRTVTVEGNGFGAFAVGGGINVTRGAVAIVACTIRDNTGNGLPAQRRVELQAVAGARVITTRGSVRAVLPPPNALEGPGDWALYLDKSAHILMRRASVQGAFYLDDNSRLDFEEVDQTASTGNLVGGNSSIRAAAVSSLAGPTVIAQFSNGTFLDTTDVDILDCVDGSADALCDATVTGVSSNCPLCPIP